MTTKKKPRRITRRFKKGSSLVKWLKHHSKRVISAVVIAKKQPKKKPSSGAHRRAAIIAYAHKLVGIHEIPAHSNDGPGVHTIQSATGAYRAPWCVSTIQHIWKNVLGSTWADRTAGAYYLADYAARHGCVIPHPVPGCAVVYHIGQGHAGTVIAVGRFGAFTAIEGNEGDAVRIMQRNSRQLRCTFILRPELR